MKFSLLLVVTLTLALNACTTLANRRELYWPEKAHGPHTDKLNQNIEDKIWATSQRPQNHPPETRPQDTPVGRW